MEQNVSRNLFIERLRTETVSARKIQNRDRLCLGCSKEPAFLAFHGHAGIITDFGAQAGQCIEERGFSAVGISR